MNIPHPCQPGVKGEDFSSVRVELGLHSPSPTLRGVREHVPDLKRFARCYVPKVHVAVPTRGDQELRVRAERSMENFAGMAQRAPQRVIAPPPKTRKPIRTGHDHNLIVRAELGVTNDVRMRKPKQKLTLRHLPDAGGA